MVTTPTKLATLNVKAVKVKGKVFNAGGDAKTVKGQASGILTAVCYLAPADTVGQHYPEHVGVTVCGGATAGCKAACLNTAGRGQMTSVQLGRARKTALFLSNRNAFLLAAANDLRKMANAAGKHGMALHVRADGTSDVLTVWLARQRPHLLDLARQSGKLTPAGLAALLAMVFYTYTKRPAKHFRGLPGVHVTYSWNEGERNAVLAAGHIAAGNNVAVVFRDRATVLRVMDTGWVGARVVDGDADDNRANDPKGVVVALYAKGRAKTDTSGFVVDA